MEGKITPAVLGGKIHKFCSQTNMEKVNQKTDFQEMIHEHSKTYRLPFNHLTTGRIAIELTREAIGNAAPNVKKQLLLI